MPLPLSTLLAGIPEGLHEALATHGILTVIGFNPADIFVAFSLPRPDQPADHRRITVHLRPPYGGLPVIDQGSPLEFKLEVGCVAQASAHEAHYGNIVRRYNQLPQEARDALCRHYYSETRIKALMRAIERQGIQLPVFDGVVPQGSVTP